MRFEGHGRMAVALSGLNHGRAEETDMAMARSSRRLNVSWTIKKNHNQDPTIITTR